MSAIFFGKHIQERQLREENWQYTIFHCLKKSWDWVIVSQITRQFLFQTIKEKVKYKKKQKQNRKNSTL